MTQVPAERPAVTTPRQVATTGWSQDPLFFGAYSYPRAGNSAWQFDILQEPVAGRLVLAGEHTIFDYHSTTHGALLSGLRAARRIADL